LIRPPHSPFHHCNITSTQRCSPTSTPCMSTPKHLPSATLPLSVISGRTASPSPRQTRSPPCRLHPHNSSRLILLTLRPRSNRSSAHWYSMTLTRKLRVLHRKKQKKEGHRHWTVHDLASTPGLVGQTIARIVASITSFSSLPTHHSGMKSPPLSPSTGA